MDTFELLPSLAQGDLRESSACELVAAIFRSRASGTLSIDAKDTGEIRAFFRAGDMCGTGGFPGFRTLTHVLLANEWVDAIQIDETGQEAAATGKRHGEILVAKRLLTPEQLRLALAEQHRQNLGLLLALEAGSYEWRGWEPPPPWAREVLVDPIGCIAEVLAAEKFAPRRERVLEWLSGQGVRLSPDWEELQHRLDLGSADMAAAALLRQPLLPGAFASASKLTKPRAEALLVALLLGGAAEPAQVAAAAPEEELLPLEPEPEPPPKQRLDEAEAIARLEAIDSGKLEVEEEPGGSLELDEPLELARDEDADQRAHELRKKMLARGLRNLGVAPQAPPPHAQGDLPAAQPGRTITPPELSQLDRENRLLVQEVQQRARSATKQNAYALLGIGPTASLESIRAAYLEKAKRFHPDRAAGPELSPFLSDFELLFSALKEAYDQIGTPESRASYDQSQKNAAGTPQSRKEEAAVLLRMGEVLLKKREFDAAVQKIRRSVDLDANGDALAALAWALVSDPKQTKHGKAEAASLINRALRAPGTTARTHYVAGVIWRTKDPASAVDAFRKALELDPNHSDASLELRLLEMRQGKKGGGVLSGIFGKRKS